MSDFLAPSKVAATFVYIIFVLIASKIFEYMFDSPTAYMNVFVYFVLWAIVGLLYFIPKFSNYLIEKGPFRR